mmetsp:Transcript_34135/g.65219  ORF Transcript_34135/g.65219 Transcript_34135/m.65219 type:complete len:160 (-) Transcript_34135:224-703(-)|eukprot:CAMPEP_0114245984 /NCGR_PEP_ID=MMETSP0058-20121206/12204_1 /TAXON_ID=36894 /ORGANISM="Pyramimonas parkeae, CCMP726" /LENGTH=159 /DNA_ID=CAMNT_0001359107 /DNA_START=53 /DNA_END=532 /DNA_ORIENTATION=-
MVALPARLSKITARNSGFVGRTRIVQRSSVRAYRVPAHAYRKLEVSARFLLVPLGDGSCEHLPQEYSMPGDIELTGAEVTVGRDDPADIVIAIPTVSGSHCQIAMVDDEFYIMDLSSTNGTFVNGKQLTPAKPEKIPIGSELIFGDEFLARFELRETDD